MILQGSAVAELVERRKEEAEARESASGRQSAEEPEEGTAADGYPRPLGSPA
jgi:hypothetical protein